MEDFDRRCLEFKRFGNSVDGRGSGDGRRGGRSPWYVLFFRSSSYSFLVPC